MTPSATVPSVPRKVVVVGGVAGGMSFAARARRLAEHAEIVVLERDPYVSFANCGLPYFVGGEIDERDRLLLHTPASLRAALDLDVRVGHEVVGIERERRVVSVRERATGRVYDEPYDALVLSTGASPFRPDVPGIDLPEVVTLRTVPDAERLRAVVTGGAGRAVVLGAGFIGLETAEAFRHAGLEVAVVELAPQVLAPLDAEMARAVQYELEANGVQVHLGASAVAVEPAGHGVTVVLSTGARLPADVVLVGIGVRPESSLAAACGLELGERGAVRVDERFTTSDPAIHAVGDAIEVVDRVAGRRGPVPLAGPANRQGRALADALFGGPAHVGAVQGTAIVRVFGLTAAVTGANERALQAAGLPYAKVHLHPNDHAGYFPGAVAIHLKVLFDPASGAILGAQAVGADGVDKRIDVLATALRAGMDVEDLADLELAYAPPFGSAKDPVNLAGMLASNARAGITRFWYAEDVDRLPADAVLLDVRNAAEFASGHLPGAVNVPHTELRDRLAEVPAGRPVRVYCLSGFRSYLAARVLQQEGWTDVATLAGGVKTLELVRPGVLTAPVAG